MPLSKASHTAKSFLQCYPYQDYDLPYIKDGLKVQRHRAQVKLLDDLCDEGAQTSLVFKNEKIRGIVSWQRLAWDSAVFKKDVGRIEHLILSEDITLGEGKIVIQSLLRRWRKCGLKYIVIRIPAVLVKTINILERKGFEIVDGVNKQIFTLRERDFEVPRIRGISIVSFQKKHESMVVKLSNAFYLDRFHSDPLVEKRVADKVHRQWVLNSCRGLADQIFVASSGQKIVGFITCKIDTQAKKYFDLGLGIIVLVAVDQNFRNRGIAKALTLRSLNWFKSRNMQVAEIGTQIHNMAATNAYLSVGFRLSCVYLTLRRAL